MPAKPPLHTEEEAEAFLQECSAAGLLPCIHTAQLQDYILDLRWSPDGTQLAALPSTGPPQLFPRSTAFQPVPESGHPACATWQVPPAPVLPANEPPKPDPSATAHKPSQLPPHIPANGTLAWSPGGHHLATFGQDSILRIHPITTPGPARTLQLPRGWAERFAWNADGTRIAVAIAKKIHIIDTATLEIESVIDALGATISDVTWHPTLPNQLATASNGGTRIWRLGDPKPIAELDQGVAALHISWSPDGRWVVTGDHTPSVHLFDTKSRKPLHIQGFETKVKSFAWQTAGAKDHPWLAVGGGTLITLWPCFGRNGPRNARPIQLPGHARPVTALDFTPQDQLLASGAADGFVLLWLPHHSPGPAMIAREDHEITSIRWAPDGHHLAYGTANGKIAIHQLLTESTP